MTYPQTYRGIRKVNTVALIRFFGLLALIIGAAVWGITTKPDLEAIQMDLNTETIGSWISRTLFRHAWIGWCGIAVLAALLLFLVIWHLIGLCQAGRQEGMLMAAFILTLIEVLGSIGVQILTNNGIGGKPVQIGTYVLLGISCISTICILGGIRRLAQELKYRKVRNLGTAAIILLVLSWALLTAVFVLFVRITQGIAVGNVILILAAAFLVVRLVYEIVYIVYLGKATRMLGW